MKNKRITIAIPEKLLEESEKIAEERMEDRSTVMRQLLVEGLKQEKIKKALRMYSEGKISMEKAAEIADVSLWKMFDLLRKKKVPLRYEKEDAEQEIKEILG